MKLNKKALQQSSHETEHRYRQLVELSPDAIVVHSEGKIAYINPSGLRLFRAAGPKDLIGKRILNYIHPEDRGLVRERIRRIDTEGVRTPLREYRIVLSGGEVVYVEATGTLVVFKNKPSNLVIFRDVTARKRAEQCLSALNERLQEEQRHRKFLSKRLIDLLEKKRHEVAMELHDQIGQLLTTLKMDLEIVLRQGESIDGQSAKRLKSAIEKTAEGIVDLKKISQGLMPRMIDNLGLIPALRALFNGIKANTKVDVQFFTRDIPKRFERDKELAIYRISQEALLNIIKHARAEKVFVTLMKKDRTISLSIEDDGVGFAAGNEAPISPDEGPLGLHIMRERVVQLGGEFFIDSREGSGTHILVELPM